MEVAKQFVVRYKVALSHFRALYLGHELSTFGPFKEVKDGQLMLPFAIADDQPKTSTKVNMVEAN